MRILLVEDDRQMIAYIRKGLGAAGHTVDSLEDGRDALAHALGETYEALLVDRRLPGLDGLALIRAYRSGGGRAAVLMLSSLGAAEHKIEGLEAGADDYLAKPFALSELLARIHAVTRRPAPAAPESVARLADLELDLQRRTARRAGRVIPLLPKEFAILAVLMENIGRIVPKPLLLERVWEVHRDPRSTLIETQVSRLRSKLDGPFERKLLRTVRGLGYTLSAEGS